MQLKLTRSQKSGGVLSSSVSFALDARVELSKDEAELVRKYKLGDLIIYNSQRAKEHLERGNAANARGTVGGTTLALIRLAAARLSLHITIDSLHKGHHIESKSLDEIMGAEDAIREGCENLRSYLNPAATYDGREQVVEF